VVEQDEVERWFGRQEEVWMVEEAWILESKGSFQGLQELAENGKDLLIEEPGL
jgi:hypothetical protein